MDSWGKKKKKEVKQGVISPVEVCSTPISGSIILIAIIWISQLTWVLTLI